MAEAIPYYTPGETLTCYATAAVNAKRFVVVSGERNNNGDDETGVIDTAGNNISAAQSGANVRVLGVAAEDAALGDTFEVIATPGAIVPVTANGTISYGQNVSADTAGKVIAQAAAAATYATVDSSGSAGANNQLTYTAKDVGIIGNGISVRLKDPSATGASLSITVNGNDIVVNLATDGGGAVTSTASSIITGIQANGPANSIITVANKTGSSGAGVVVAEASPKQLAGGAEATNSTAVGMAVAGATTGEDAQIKLF